MTLPIQNSHSSAPSVYDSPQQTPSVSNTVCHSHESGYHTVTLESHSQASQDYETVSDSLYERSNVIAQAISSLSTGDVPRRSFVLEICDSVKKAFTSFGELLSGLFRTGGISHGGIQHSDSVTCLIAPKISEEPVYSEPADLLKNEPLYSEPVNAIRRSASEPLLNRHSLRDAQALQRSESGSVLSDPAEVKEIQSRPLPAIPGSDRSAQPGITENPNVDIPHYTADGSNDLYARAVSDPEKHYAVPDFMAEIKYPEAPAIPDTPRPVYTAADNNVF